MQFQHHNFLGDIELNKKEVDGIRLYNLPDDQWVPSITSVTSFYNRQIFADWRSVLVLKKQIVFQNVQLKEVLTFTKQHSAI